MAYKEYTITCSGSRSGKLVKQSDPILREDYPDEASFLALRNAAEGNFFSLSGSSWYLRTGVYSSYPYEDPTFIYQIDRAILVWLNSSNLMPGSPIEYAAILLSTWEYSNLIDTVIVQNGQPTYPHIPAIGADYNKDNYSGNGGSLSPPATPYGYRTVEVTPSWIDITSEYIAKLCLRTSSDIDGTYPSIDRRYNNNPSLRPKLVFRITLSIPISVTKDYTNKGVSAATFNGEVTHSGYWMDSYGFEWKQGESGDVSSVTKGTNRIWGLEFSHYQTGLSGTIYYRAWGENEAGKGYGEWKSISFVAVTTQAASNIGIEHAKGHGTATGEDITERGFEIKRAFAGTLGDYIKRAIAGFTGIDVVCSSFGYWEGYVIKTKRYVGTFGEGAFVGDLGRFPTAVFSDQLFAGETYDYRAYAIIGGEKYFGGYLPFTTNTWPVGKGPEDKVSPGVPIVSISEEEELLPFWEWPEIVFPPWVTPSFVLPPFEYDPSIVFGHTFGAFLRRLDTKEDWQTLREKCIIYQENMNQFTLTINHNTLVLKNLVNDIITYIDGNVYPSNLKLMDSSQHLTPLYLEEISPDGFKDIINDFRLKDVCNVYELNQNFQRMIQSLNSLYSSDYTIEPISYNTREYIDIQPTAKRMILQLEDMRKKSREVQRLIIENIKRIFTYV